MNLDGGVAVAMTEPVQRRADIAQIDMMAVKLEPEQQRVVEMDPHGRHVLITAPPGSGKTLTITRRMAQLLQTGKAKPEEILALTFTERAAEELAKRLGQMLKPGISAMTFHGWCLSVLRAHGIEAGVPMPIRIMTELETQEVVRVVAADMGMPGLNDHQVKALVRGISLSKRERATAEALRMVSGFNESIYQPLFEAYSRRLGELGSVDYDDLISRTADLLWETPEVSALFHQRYRFVFVDEFQDVSIDQYRLLLALAPPTVPNRQVCVVADANQAIFAFRGSDAERMLNQFRTDYHPQPVQLRVNHRSVGEVVTAAKHLIVKGGHEEMSRAVREPGLAIDCLWFADATHEAKSIARLIDHACESGYLLSEIAILTRRHKRLDTLEMHLVEKEKPVFRLRPDRFIDLPEAQEMIRFFELASSFGDRSFIRAVNWPRFLVDELTMVALQTVAAEEDVSLTDVARDAASLRQRLSPLSATLISQLMEPLAAELERTQTGDAEEIVTGLLRLIEHRRAGLPLSRRGDFRATLDEIDNQETINLDLLVDAVSGPGPISVGHDDSVDAQLAANLLARVFLVYFGHDVQVQRDQNDPTMFWFGKGADPGSVQPDAPLERNAVAEMTLTARVFRLAQRLLMAFEFLDLGEFVVLDIETTSNRVASAELLEIGAVRVRDGLVTDDEFHLMVRPSGPDAITRDAQAVHGLRWEDVKDGVDPGVAVDHLLAFVGDGPVVAHNGRMFDFPVIERVAKEEGFDAIAWKMLDSCQLARRLFPGRPASLDALITPAEKTLRDRQGHGALADARMTANVWIRLLAELRRDREIDLLCEYLPVVAASLMATDVSRTSPDDDLIALAGSRTLNLGDGSADCAWSIDLIRQLGGDTLLDRLRGIDWRSDVDDDRWQQLTDEWGVILNRFARSGRVQTLEGFLDYLRLATPSELEQEPVERLTMMSVYSAKGQEWPVVFMVGMEDGEYPYSMESSEEEIAEARRVLYVGMTRAANRLIMTGIGEFEDQPRSPSRFLRDLPSSVRFSGFKPQPSTK